MQGVAAALERAAMRHDRVELRQFRLQMLIDHQQRFQRTADVAIAASCELSIGCPSGPDRGS
jgi:hypothetical protein